VLQLDKETLLAYQPDYYKNSTVMQNINNANANELTLFNNKIATVYNNLYINTADSYTLARYEKELGLTIATNYDLSYRVSRIYSRMLGNGNFTKAFIKTMADGYTNGNVEVTVNSSDYSFTIKFTSVLGIPPNIDDLMDFIEEYKAAHMAVNYVFIYNIYNDLSNKTNNTLSTYTYEQLRSSKF
jgi:hypothetical protein